MIFSTESTVITATIVLAAVLFAGLINAKIYNILHGFITIIGVSSILALILYTGQKSGSAMTEYQNAITYVVLAFEYPMLILFSTLKFTFMDSYSDVAFYLIPIAVFIVSFILASMLRRFRKNRD